MLERYLQMFAKLRTDWGRHRYPEITHHRAPHKLFLVHSVMDLIAQGRITQNLIEPSGALGAAGKVLRFNPRGHERVDGRHSFFRLARVVNQALQSV